MRQLYLEIESCSECPYCHYDSYYSCSTDSGYDCEHPDTPQTRIVDDYKVKEFDWKVPKWCPLDDMKTLEIALHQWRMKHISN